MASTWLVTGGAGYIGAHLARALHDRGDRVVNYDDLSTGHREAVHGELVVGDVRDRGRLAELVARLRPDGIFHFAALALVAESRVIPFTYADVNVAGTAAVAAAALALDPPCPVVFSSSCSIYGDPPTVPVTESCPPAPCSAYGRSKWMAELVLAEAAAQGLPVAALRYFNAAGAHPDGSLGESHRPETHLVPSAILAALRRAPPLKVFGTDLPTRDGTCIRDYVHVVDLAAAHVAAMERLRSGAPGGTWNLGSGRGSTVLEVIDAVGRVVGQPVPWHPAPPRPGDPPALHADIRQAARDLDWRPTWDLEAMVEHAVRWLRNPRYGNPAVQ